MVADICLGLAAFAYRAFKDGGRGHGRTFLIAATAALVIRRTSLR
jgi:hypothetical protein